MTNPAAWTSGRFLYRASMSSHDHHFIRPRMTMPHHTLDERAAR